MDPQTDAPRDPASPVTLRTLRRMAERGDRFACLTCYDASTARLLERAGVHVLLVGDTAAEMVLGLPGTIHAPLELMIALTAAVRRGAPGTVVMADMPFMSYQADRAEAIRNAGRFLTEGMADLVKLEVDGRDVELVDDLARAGIPVVAHLGSRPQHAKRDGGYRSVGRTAREALALVRAATAMETAGATMLLLEAMPAEVSAAIVERISIPVISCGAGPACHGEVIVLQDALGISDWQPAFARPVAAIREAIVEAGRAWAERVGASGSGSHPYTMGDGEAAALTAALSSRPALDRPVASEPPPVVTAKPRPRAAAKPSSSSTE